MDLHAAMSGEYVRRTSLPHDRLQEATCPLHKLRHLAPGDFGGGGLFPGNIGDSGAVFAFW
jgi:hypothetical protein